MTEDAQLRGRTVHLTQIGPGEFQVVGPDGAVVFSMGMDELIGVDRVEPPARLFVDTWGRMEALREERDWFKGEMEQFMRAASANHARVALLEGLLREVQWGGIQMERAIHNNRLLLERACPSCGRGQSKGHAPDCRLAAALAGVKHA